MGNYLMFIAAMVFALFVHQTTLAQALVNPKPPAPSGKFEEVPATAEEPLAKLFSLERAARSLDAGAINFSQTHRCIQCHANLMYLLARPHLEGVLKSPPDMRAFQDWIVETRWLKTGVVYDNLGAAHAAVHGDKKTLPATEPIVVALGLAFHDRATTSKLHPATRKALDTVIARQRPDGGFNVVHDGVGSMMNDFDQAALAGLAIVAAPEKFAASEKPAVALAGVRKYLAAYKNPGLYQKGLMLWASDSIGNLISAEQRKQFVDELTRLQRPDGGWCLAELQPDDEKQQRGKFSAKRPTDGYGTGFVVFVLRQGALAVDSATIQRGVNWLKTNQRESGRWFTNSLVGRPDNLISNSGSAFAILALAACGEIPAR